MTMNDDYDGGSSSSYNDGNYDHSSGSGESRRPACQAAGCFEPATVYVVISEAGACAASLGTWIGTEGPLPSSSPTLPSHSPSSPSSFAVADDDKDADSGNNIDGSLEYRDPNAFKLILYLCARHDYDLKYLLKENELEISKRRHLVLREAL